MERDFFQIYMTFNWNNFNSHAHVERDNAYNFVAFVDDDFNSHAHVERDSPFYQTAYQIPISTHTLTWSVTGQLLT